MVMMDDAIMRRTTKKRALTNPSRSVQISLKRELLQQIDADEEVRHGGRSAFITQAILTYMRLKKRKQVDDQFAAAFAGRAEEILADSRPLIDSQAWPPDDDLVEIGEPAPAQAAAGRRR